MKSIKRILAVLAIVCCLAACSFVTASANQTAFTKVIQSEIAKVNNEREVAQKSRFVMHLTATDFMTSENHTNDNWVNADDGNVDVSDVNLDEYDLCNFLLDKNLSDYNYESKVLIDGIPLSQYKLENPYVLSGNHRQRLDTLSINFTNDIVGSVETIEVLQGCQFPTLARSCMGYDELSCIEITETVKYVNADGVWQYYFEGYEEGTQYVADEKMFKLSQTRTYKGHDVAPTAGFTNFFDGRDVSGEFHEGSALASRGNTEKNTIVVVRLVNPVDSKLFNTIVLKVQSNHIRTVVTYNDQTENSLGNALESFTLNGWAYTTIKLTSSLYADENGMVDTIIFKFAEDGEPVLDSEDNIQYDELGNIERDQFFVLAIGVENKTNDAILSNESFMVFETDDAYEITFRFNKTGEDRGDVTLDLTKVTLNGVTFKKILSECNTATAKWQVIGSIFQINASIPKSYTGDAQIKNVDQNYNSNTMSVLEGLTFPNGDVLEKTYVCHLYSAEKILDCDMVDEYEDIKVEKITYKFVSGSDNIQITVTFDKKITSRSYVHVCELERWRATDLVKADSSYYDEQTSRAFVNGGYKSALLENVIINGLNIAEWHAQPGVSLTNVQVHYGNSGLYSMDICFEKKSPATYDIIYDLITGGEGLTVEIREGLKFTTDTKVKKTQVFTLKNGSFSEVVASRALHVYYDGTEITNGASLTVNADVSENSLFIDGVEGYQVSTAKNGNVTEFTLTYGENKQFKFTVTKDFVPTEIAVQMGSSVPPTESVDEGCNAMITVIWVLGGVLLVAGAVALVFILRKLKEKKSHE